MSNSVLERGLKIEEQLLKDRGELMERLFPVLSNTKYLANESRGHLADALVMYQNELCHLDVKYTSWSFDSYCEALSNNRHISTLQITKKCYDFLRSHAGSLICVYSDPDHLLMLLDVDQLVPVRDETIEGTSIQRVGVPAGSIIKATRFTFREKPIQ